MSSKVADVKTFFDDTQKYLQHNPIIALRRELIYEVLGAISGKAILDAGCGNGSLSAVYAQANQLTLIDISANMLEEAKNELATLKSSAEAIICGDIEQQSYSRKFDVILLVGVLAHVSDPAQLVKKYAELLNQNGTLILQFTNSSHWVAKLNASRKKKREKNTYQYSINSTSNEDVMNWTKRADLIVAREFSYFPVAPFFSFCPKAWRLTLIRSLVKFPFTRQAGSEKLLFLSKK